MTILNNLAILIPARSGSRRLVDKNIKLLAGEPLLGIAISKALQLVGSQNVFVSTESKPYAELARSLGANVPNLRPEELALDSSTDIEWLLYSLNNWDIEHEFISILRPTSPFLNAASISVAFETLRTNERFDSIRAIRKVTEHPGKMWRETSGDEIIPMFPQVSNETPSHSRPTQSLENVYVQCGAFEIARHSAVLKTQTISGWKILGHVLEHPESLDINSPEDFLLAELYSQSNKV